MSRAATGLAACALLAACSDDTTRPWELVHDRILAVRATPPQIEPGGSAVIDVLITSEAAGPTPVAPLQLAVAPGMPSALAGTVVGATVVAPDPATLEAARAELGLAPGAVVPLVVGLGVAIGDEVFAATKTVVLGAAAANPAIGDLRIDGAPVGDRATAAAGERELAIDAPDTDVVRWLTSAGELDDDEDPIAHLTVDAPGPATVVVIRRDPAGGVAWRIVELAVE